MDRNSDMSAEVHPRSSELAGPRSSELAGPRSSESPQAPRQTGGSFTSDRGGDAMLKKLVNQGSTNFIRLSALPTSGATTGGTAARVDTCSCGRDCRHPAVVSHSPTVLVSKSCCSASECQ